MVVNADDDGNSLKETTTASQRVFVVTSTRERQIAYC